MGEQAFHSGAVGMILANDIRRWNDVIADPHLLPASHINFTDGEFVFEYLNSTKYTILEFSNLCFSSSQP